VFAQLEIYSSCCSIVWWQYIAFIFWWNFYFWIQQKLF